METMKWPGVDIQPPWVVYPGQFPWWVGWRQGGGEAWLMSIWRPYWRSLDEQQQLDYLQQWSPPLAWRDFLLHEGMK